MAKAEIVNISISESFSKLFEEFLKLIEADKEFQETIKKMNKRYAKKNKQNKHASAKIRYAIAFYVRDRRRKMLNAQTNNTNQETENL